MMPYCNCAEIKNGDGKDYNRVPEWHDCEYIYKRNKLIDEAEEFAIANATNENGYTDPYRFTQLFSNKMDQMAKENGLV